MYQGERSALRGRPHGEPSAHLPSVAFVAFLQNHDQIGNRAFGRTRVRAGGRRRGATPGVAARGVLLAPQVPLMFMGEEWDAATPFLYFCDFHGELADAVRQGRRQEFARFEAFADPMPARASPIRTTPPPSPRACSTAPNGSGRRTPRPSPARGRCWRCVGAIWCRAWRATAWAASRTRTPACCRWTGLLGDGALWHLALNLRDQAAPLPMAGERVHALRATDAEIAPRGVRVSVEPVGTGAGA